MSGIKPAAFAIRNDQGFWCGIWNDRAVAESVLKRGQPSHHEGIVPLVDADDPVLVDQREIADSCTRSDIECHCAWTEAADGRWYDVNVTDEWEIEAIAQAVRYLDARGLIERHPEHANWVRFKA